MLGKEGFRVLQAGSGPEARAVAAEHLPDLIILDILMPGETGLETCVRLKQDSRTAAIPVIFISDLNDVENKVKGFALGAVDYITKPFEKAEVLARVRLHLRLSQTHRELIEAHSARLRQLSHAQQSILVHPESLPEARFAVCYRPAMEAGGDFYDVVPIADGIFGYLVADISGHDLAASLLTSAVKVVVSRFAGPHYTPGETVRALNDLIRPVLAEGQFLTLAYAHLNRRRNRLTLIGAGHPPAILVGADGRSRILESEGDVLGVFESVLFEPSEFAVSGGDRLFLYTDGLIESPARPGRRSARIDELAAACLATRHLPLAEALPQVVQCVLAGDAAAQDDLLLLGFEV
jgi:sigma-B regulation protein RsbU (phosphoserine phosphatase)